MGEIKLFLSLKPRTTIFWGEAASFGSLQSPAEDGARCLMTVKLRQRQSVIKPLSLPQAKLSLGKGFGCGGL